MKWLKLYWYTWMQEYNERMFSQTKEIRYAKKADYYLDKMRGVKWY